MEDKQTETIVKPAFSKWKNGRLILRFLRGSIPLLSFALLASILNTAFNALTPQIIRVTVDTFLSDSTPSSLPQWLAAPLQNLALTPGKALIMAAGAILLTSALSDSAAILRGWGLQTDQKLL